MALAVKHRGQAEKRHKAHHVGDGGEHNATRQRRINPESSENHRNKYPRESRHQKIDDERHASVAGPARRRRGR